MYGIIFVCCMQFYIFTILAKIILVREHFIKNNFSRRLHMYVDHR